MIFAKYQMLALLFGRSLFPFKWPSVVGKEKNCFLKSICLVRNYVTCVVYCEAALRIAGLPNGHLNHGPCFWKADRRKEPA